MTDPQAAKPGNIRALLAQAQPRSGRRRLVWMVAGVLLLAGVLATTLVIRSRGDKGPRYVTAAASAGDITVTVSATGNLQPTNTVDIGSEISGTIAKTFADYNDKVKKGQVLAQIDTTKLALTIERARATLEANQAKAAQARATLEESRLSLARLEEVSRISGGKVPSATELDAARAKLDRARADLATAEAAGRESAGALKAGETDLGKATIRSPIDGVVLKRSVERGQTVAASLQAPVMFSLAEDLAEMELVVAVSEADVGQVGEGMKASFTVDAYPDKVFPATIRQVRYGATNVDNVVSYQTVLQVKNEDLSLRPGMTATADIKVAEHKGVLLVPNAALRFKPAERAKKESGGVLSVFMPRPPSGRSGPGRPEQSGRKGEGGGKNRAKVWIKTAEGLKPIPVKTLLSDGRNTEVESEQLKPGDEVVVDVEEAAK
ncbi:MAG: efflux RND transporter periplasmic adaptor subunit [Uliginosibacterium sp.]|nr:efflux RND transporter periplasmic adaptor subunit [Uliginosibacterium sp.]